MANTKSRSYLKILRTAVTLFSKQGYHGTSTRDIADKAGVSETTLFRCFASKEELFWLALRSCSERLTKSDMLVRVRRGDSIQAVLPEIIDTLCHAATKRPEALRLFSIAYIELEKKADAECRVILSPILSEINEYLALSVAKREIMDVDPSLLAASLAATAFIHRYFVRFTRKAGLSPNHPREASKAYTKFWLDILVPRTVALATETVAAQSLF
jgi:AcrR family transcriptional regulator